MCKFVSELALLGFGCCDTSRLKGMKFLEAHLGQSLLPYPSSRTVAGTVLELKEALLEDLKIKRNTSMVVNFHISQHGSGVEQDSHVYLPVNIRGSWAGQGRRGCSEILMQKAVPICLF